MPVLEFSTEEIIQLTNTRQGDNSTIHSLSQAFPSRRIAKVPIEVLRLLALARSILHWAMDQNKYERGDLPNELKGTNQRIFLSFEKLDGLLMKELVSGLFDIANLQSTLKQVQEGIERANGDIQSVFSLERLSRSIANANVLGDLFEVLRLLSLAYERLIDALDEELRLRKRGQQKISEVSPLEKKGLEDALIEELRLALLE